MGRAAAAAPPVQQRSFLRDVMAGTAGGLAVCLVGHPFDTLKVRLQTQPIQQPIYNGLWDCVKKTLKWEGLGGLYKGVGSPIVGQMFFRAVLFSSYGQSKALLTDWHQAQSPAATPLPPHLCFVAGTLTGVAASFVEGPIDLFKSQVQVQILREKSLLNKGLQPPPPQYTNVFDCAYKIASRHGLRGVYQGLGATLLRNIPANTFFFGGYEWAKASFARLNHAGDASKLRPWELMSSGGVGGLLYWTLTYPTDVIKSSMQGDNPHKPDRNFSSIVDCTRKLYQQHGWRRFTRGFTPCLMRSIPANAAMFLVVEKMHTLLADWV
ncbi:Mitochondrial carrier [Balamuthia mandrillaris]